MFYQKAFLLMKIKLTALIIMTGTLSACAENPVHVVPEPITKVAHKPYIPDQRLELGKMTMSGPLSYNYKIYGDPVVAPAQVFSDANFLYLQLSSGQVPPIPVTRDGKLVEYEVKRGFMIMPKVESLVLRIGPRKAYVDTKSLDIIRYEPIRKSIHVPTFLNVEISSPEPTAPPKKVVEEPKASPINKFSFNVGRVIKQSDLEVLGLSEARDGQWRICSYPGTISFKSALKLKLQMVAKGWKVDVDPKCKSDKQKIILEKL